MKYYLLNKEDCVKSIWTNPSMIRTKSVSKIKKYRKLKVKLDKLYKEIEKELKSSNTVINQEKIDKFLLDSGVEITRAEYNSMYAIPLYDTQEQRISSYWKTNVMKGKLYGEEIRLEKDK